MRFIAICALIFVLAVNLSGFAFLALGWFVGSDITVKGGLPTVVVSAVTVMLCVSGIRWLRDGGRGARPTANRT